MTSLYDIEIGDAFGSVADHVDRYVGLNQQGAGVFQPSGFAEREAYALNEDALNEKLANLNQWDPALADSMEHQIKTAMADIKDYKEAVANNAEFPEHIQQAITQGEQVLRQEGPGTKHKIEIDPPSIT